MNKFTRYIALMGCVMAVSGYAFASEAVLRLEFSGVTPEANQVSLQPAGFGQYPMAKTEFGAIPTDNAFPGATDGRGVLVEAAPGTGVMIFGPVIPTSQLVLARCAVRTSGPNAQVTIATIDMGSNVFVSQNRPENGGYFANQYRRIATLTMPRPGGLQPLIQVFNPSSTDHVTAYLDNFEFIQLTEGQFYNVDFLDGDENDPSVICLPSEEPSPTPTPDSAPTGTPVPTVPPAEPTPTSTEVPTPTWTPTPVSLPSGIAAGLRLTACDPEKPVSLNAGNQVFLPVRIDLIDAAGRIVNPGTEEGDREKEVTVTVTGSARISPGGSTTTVMVNRPEGKTVLIWDTAAEEVTVTATSSGLTAAVPVKVRFVPAGGISGMIQAWNGVMYTIPMLVSVSAHVYQSGTNQSVEDVHFNMEMDGRYTITGLPAGVYDVQFEPSEPMSIPGLPEDIEIPGFSTIPLQTVCVQGITVAAGQTTPGVNVDLGPRSGGANVHGTISRTDGTPVEMATVFLIPDSGAAIGCEKKEWIATVMNMEQSPDFVPLYRFKDIPAGRYRVYCVAYQADSQATNGDGEYVTLIAGQDTELNIMVKPVVPITPESPLGYKRESQPVRFQWSVPAGTPPMMYTVSVIDSCNNLLWSENILNQTYVFYTGPGLSNQEMYSWSVIGWTQDGSTTGSMVGVETTAEPVFMVK